MRIKNAIFRNPMAKPMLTRPRALNSSCPVMRQRCATAPEPLPDMRPMTKLQVSSDKVSCEMQPSAPEGIQGAVFWRAVNRGHKETITGPVAGS
jgi:hypothetical protein